jgi:ribosomal protein L3 glutamine methyltransferase
MSENAVLVLEIGHEKRYFNQAFPELEPLWLAPVQGRSRCCYGPESTGFA